MRANNMERELVFVYIHKQSKTIGKLTSQPQPFIQQLYERVGIQSFQKRLNVSISKLLLSFLYNLLTWDT